MNLKIKDELRRAIRDAINDAGSQTAFAMKSKVAQQSLSKYISKGKNGSDCISERVLRALLPHVKSYLPDNSEYFAFMEDFNNVIEPSSPPPVLNTIRNTPELRECIKDAMLEQGIRDASALCKLIGYDTPNTLERLLSGKINWFPDMLSAVLDNLKINHDSAPISPSERELLHPEGVYTNDGTFRTRSVLVHYQPLLEWAQAASYIENMISNENTLMEKWNPETVGETVPVPLDIRGRCLVFRVSGQSMEPAILDGDIIYCEEATDITMIPDKRVVVVKFSDRTKFEECVVCKRFRRIKGNILLTSDNPAGREFEITPEDISWIGILRRLSKNGESI